MIRTLALIIRATMLGVINNNYIMFSTQYLFPYVQSYPGSGHGASPYSGLSPISEVPVLVSSPASGVDSVPQVSSTAQDNTGQHLHVSTTRYNVYASSPYYIGSNSTVRFSKCLLILAYQYVWLTRLWVLHLNIRTD